MKTNKGFAPILMILILVAVVGIGLYAEKQTRNKENKTPPVVIEKEPKQEESKNQEEKKPISLQDSKVTFLKNLLLQYSSTAGISECSYNNDIYYSVRIESTGDSGSDIYSSSEKKITNCGGFYPPNYLPQGSDMCKLLQSCTIVYAPYFHDDYSGATRQKIDVYNINP